VQSAGEPRTVPSPPSDAATDEAARIYHVQLRSLDAPGLRVNWGGRHTAATLAALRHAHTIDGPIRQFEWGSYEWVLDGAATRHLLLHVLEGDDWQGDTVEVVHLSRELRERFRPAGVERGVPSGAERGIPAGVERGVPARVEGDMPVRSQRDDSIVKLGPLLERLDDRCWYSVMAEVY
jgi:hypothetical protein